MDGDWDFYLLTSEGRPASIYLDLAIEVAGPDAARPWSAFVRVMMNAPREDGLSSQAEFETLSALEDALVDAVTAEGARYAGRITVAGRRDFYFFVADPGAFEGTARSALAGFEGYGGEIGAREDRAWRTYFGFLLPPPATRRRMMNRRVRDQLEAHGDALDAPRPIDHAASFPTEESRAAFAAERAAEGYSVAELAPPARDGAYWVYFTMTAAPDGIDAVAEALYAASARHGGAYDGWGCDVSRPPADHESGAPARRDN